MNRNKKDEPWVSASKAGRASFCPHYLELERKGTQISSKAQTARIRGDQKHEDLNRKAITNDKRCYVASHLYGVDDPRTELLREFRDKSLTNNHLGKLLINVYYRLSPLLVSIARNCPFIDKLLRKSVNRIIGELDKDYNNG